MLNRLGLCAPASCSNHHLANATQHFWNNKTLLALDMFDISAQVIQVRSTEMSNFFDRLEMHWISR